MELTFMATEIAYKNGYRAGYEDAIREIMNKLEAMKKDLEQAIE